MVITTTSMLLAFGSASAKEYTHISNAYTKITASSVEGDMYPVSHLVDGDNESRWASAWSDVQTIEMDFDGAKPIDKIVLNWEDAFAHSLKIYGKKYNENSNWELVRELSSLNGGETVIEDNLGSFRMLKFEMSDRELSQYGISLYEIEVFSEVNHILAKEVTLQAQSTYNYGQYDECNSANHGKMVMVTSNYKTSQPHSYIKACLMSSTHEAGSSPWSANVYFEWVKLATGTFSE